MAKIPVNMTMVSLANMADNPEHHRQRSEFIRGLVQRPREQGPNQR